jgi:ABC-type multidrug transport system permease subunit
MMTLSRYLLVGKDHSSWLVKQAKLEYKWVIRGFFLFSALINIGHGWQYQTVYEFQFRNDVNEIEGYSYSESANQGTAYFIYSIVYFCLSFGVFFILNTGIEVQIVRHMKTELKEKRERIAEMNSSSPLFKLVRLKMKLNQKQT